MEIKIIQTSEEIGSLVSRANDELKLLGINPKVDEFTIVQTYNNGMGIVMTVEDEDGERKVKMLVNDSIVVLPKIDGILDVFQ